MKLVTPEKVTIKTLTGVISERFNKNDTLMIFTLNEDDNEQGIIFLDKDTCSHELVDTANGDCVVFNRRYPKTQVVVIKPDMSHISINGVDKVITSLKIVNDDENVILTRDRIKGSNGEYETYVSEIHSL